MLVKRINESEADFIIDSNGVLFKYEGWNRNAVVIPDDVIAIGEGAFKFHHELKSVKMGNNVKIIGAFAFKDCNNLTSINIPDSVTKIGDDAFSGCSALSSINIPDSVTVIGKRAFSDCIGLISVNIPNSVTEISDWAFSDCIGLISVNIPNSVTRIGDWAFESCSGIISINIPNSVTVIDRYAFYGCSRLSSINIPNSVTVIGRNTFYGCTKCNVIIPNNILNFSYVIDCVKSINGIPIEDLCFIGNDQSTLIVTEDEFVLSEINGNKCAVKYIVQDYSKYTGYLFVAYPDRTFEAFSLDLNSFTDGVRLIKVCGLYNDYPIGVRKDGKKTFLSSEYRGQWFDDCGTDSDGNLYINGEKVN